MNNFDYEAFFLNALTEDIQKGDYTTLACVDKTSKGKAKLLAKQNGILAGIDIITKFYKFYNKEISLDIFYKDGDIIAKNDIIFEISGKSQDILSTERIVLNILQRMSGIATTTRMYVIETVGTKAKILDTRKTTPGFRFLEKEAVRIGGGVNHRFGLYDMIMIKDNHIDYAGGIEKAITKTKKYLDEKKIDLKIEIEARNFEEIEEIMQVGGVDRIMIDNFTPEDCKKAVVLINNKYETEASGGININTVKSYADTGVNYISVGAITHNYKSLDLSLKAVK
ncbi:MAG: carboxylating nicotinate-nucleotide diphosphorylase [Bacteroidetes bacterium]|nr:MAG: carboxylating nicotinate-nucleotide diphosphorylase [Bacteroidota bacterium]